MNRRTFFGTLIALAVLPWRKKPRYAMGVDVGSGTSQSVCSIWSDGDMMMPFPEPIRSMRVDDRGDLIIVLNSSIWRVRDNKVEKVAWRFDPSMKIRLESRT